MMGLMFGQSPALARTIGGSIMMKKLLACALLGSLSVAAPSASAAVLLILINAPVQSQTPYLGPNALPIIATKPVTELTLGGYQLPSYIQLTDISVVPASGGGNLLGPTWTFVAAPTDGAYGTYADQNALGGLATGTNAVEFGSTIIGSYDGFKQSFPTFVGQTYELNFLYTQDYPGPNGLQIVVDQPLEQSYVLPVPEPAMWVMLLAGFGFIGSMLRRRGGQSLRRA